MRGLRLAFGMLAVSIFGLALCLGAVQPPWSAAHAAGKAAHKGAETVVEGENIPIEDEGVKAPMADTGEAEPQARPVPPTTGEPAPVTLTAYLAKAARP